MLSAARKGGGKQAYVSVERQNKHAENADINGCVDRCLPDSWSRPCMALHHVCEVWFGVGNRVWVREEIHGLHLSLRWQTTFELKE